MLARALLFLPLLTPMVIILRLSASSDIWIVEIIASIILLAAAVLVVISVAEKVFRIGPSGRIRQTPQTVGSPPLAKTKLNPFLLHILQ